MTPRPLCRLLIAIFMAAIPLLALAGPRPGGGRDRTGPPFHTREDIQYAQKVLTGIGHLKAGTFKPGELDDETLRAVRAFQREHSLPPGGWLDPETMGMLTSHEKPETRAPVARAKDETPG